MKSRFFALCLVLGFLVAFMPKAHADDMAKAVDEIILFWLRVTRVECLNVSIDMDSRAGRIPPIEDVPQVHHKSGHPKKILWFPQVFLETIAANSDVTSSLVSKMLD